jgi:hypothetical protein
MMLLRTTGDEERPSSCKHTCRYIHPHKAAGALALLVGIDDQL